jgi:hypothetical protein
MIADVSSTLAERNMPVRSSRTVAAIVAIVLLALLTGGVASAAPANAKYAELIALDCANGQAYTIVVSGNGHFAPGHILEGGQGILIPTAFTFTAMDADGNILFTDSSSKGGQRHGNADNNVVSCTFDGEFEQGGETLAFVGIVTGTVVRPGN